MKRAGITIKKNKMIAIIDIGSNSVRLAVFDNDKIEFKGKINSKLGEGLATSGEITEEAEARTLSAIKTLIVKAILFGVERQNIFAFATATVRRAKNGTSFCDKVFAQTAIKVDVVSEDSEAMLAITGALGDSDGAVLDIGGGSAELIVRENGKITYKNSLPLGAVVLYDMFGYDRQALDKYIKNAVKEYGNVPKIDKLIAVGGTATCCAFVMARARAYDQKITQGKIVSLEDLQILADKFFTFTDEEKEQMGVEAGRVKIIANGTALLIGILEYLGLTCYTASENDNLLGYYQKRRKQLNELRIKNSELRIKS